MALTQNTDPHSRFLARMLGRLLNDPYADVRISWGVEYATYNFNVSTSHGTFAFTLDTCSSDREWPPSIEVLEAAVTKFEQLYPELVL